MKQQINVKLVEAFVTFYNIRPREREKLFVFVFEKATWRLETASHPRDMICQIQRSINEHIDQPDVNNYGLCLYNLASYIKQIYQDYFEWNGNISIVSF